MISESKGLNSTYPLYLLQEEEVVVEEEEEQKK